MIARNQDGDLVEFTDRDQIERALCDENARRFNQANDTPFMTEPLFNQIGRLGVGAGSSAILDGTFRIPEGTDFWAAKLIPHLARVKEVGSSGGGMDPTISLESHCEGWRQAKEDKSSGPSGITFAHFKAGALDPVIADLEARMTAIPYTLGISPTRWQKGINVMLEKQKGNFNVEKLRAILLYEADFNQNNKKLGKEMMYTAERLQAIVLEQFGSRNKLSAVDQSLNKRLTFDLI